MKSVQASMYIQTFYMFFMGIGFLLFPNFILPLFGFTPTTEVWIRILGALSAVVSTYYYAMIKQENIGFYYATIWGRYGFCSCLVILAILGIGSKTLFLFAFFEAGLAIWAQISLVNLKN